MNAAVARAVVSGRPPSPPYRYPGDYFVIPDDLKDELKYKQLSWSTDIAQAWELIERMRDESNDVQENFIADLVPQRDQWATENDLSIGEDMLFNVLRWLLWKADAPLAISRAFLKAHGVTEIESDDRERWNKAAK